jgi:hypothetical protein
VAGRPLLCMKCIQFMLEWYTQYLAGRKSDVSSFPGLSYYTLVCRCTALLRLLPATAATCAIMLIQNHFPEPNRHVLDFLHPISLCRIVYWAPLESISTGSLAAVKWAVYCIQYFGWAMTNSSDIRVCHIVALPFTLKGIWRQKQNYENSNISPCKNIFFKKSSKKSQNPSRFYNSITNLKFQYKPKYHLSKILI